VFYRAPSQKTSIARPRTTWRGSAVHGAATGQAKIWRLEKQTCARLLRRLSVVEARGLPENTQESTECVWLTACWLRLLITTRRHGLWNAVSNQRSLNLAAMPDTPGSRIVGPKARRKKWSTHRSSRYLASRPFRTLNLGTRHAREVSCGGTAAICTSLAGGVRVGRSAADSNSASFTSEEQATLLAGSRIRTLSFLFALSRAMASVNARLPYLIRLRRPSTPSPHPVTAAVVSGKQKALIPAALHRQDPCSRCENHVHAKVCE
jgi:hypothetical protein